MLFLENKDANQRRLEFCQHRDFEKEQKTYEPHLTLAGALLKQIAINQQKTMVSTVLHFGKYESCAEKPQCHQNVRPTYLCKSIPKSEYTQQPLEHTRVYSQREAL